MKINKELITPTIAKTYLERNVFNRKVKQPVVIKYANDISNGRWKEDTGELIKISKTGVILDGQHRLLAVVKSNTPINFHIAYDVEDSVFDVLDTGSVRNANDCFDVQRIKQGNTIPSIISMYNLLKNGKRIHTQVNHKSTNALLLEQYFEDEIFWQNVARCAHSWYLAFAKILQPSYFGGFYAYFYKVNPLKAESFMNQLASGVDIENNVINLLRNKLMQDKMSARKMPSTLKMALIVKCWNVYITNTSVKILKFDTVRDEFPIALNS